jgi:hypothetical protein
VTNTSTGGAAQVARLEQALTLLDAATREPQLHTHNDPIVVAGVGWRTGSTLVQRALMTDPDVLIWGEPMDRAFYLDRLMEPLLAVTEEWPADNHWLSHRSGVDLARDWVATLSPDPGHLKAGYSAFFDRWLAAPARDRGFTRWGFKEVRCSGAHALALRWLYPQCHLVLTIRHPVTAYISLRNSGFDPPRAIGIIRWPDRLVVTLDDYATFWNEMALSWAAVRDRLGVHWFRYEDLVEGKVDLDAIGSRISLSTRSLVARSVRIGDGLLDIALSADERARVNELTAEGRELFAYAE